MENELYLINGFSEIECFLFYELYNVHTLILRCYSHNAPFSIGSDEFLALCSRYSSLQYIVISSHSSSRYRSWIRLFELRLK